MIAMHYLHVLRHIVLMSHRQALMYRVDYVLRIIRAILDIGASVILINVFYIHTPEIAGWNRYESLVVFAFFQMVSNGVFMFGGYGIEALQRDIVRGRLDKYLTQPIDAQFSASVQITFITMIFRVLFAAGVLVYALLNLNHHVTPLQSTLSLVSFISGMVIYYSFLFLTSTIAFWTSTGELWYMAENITTVSRYPTDFFSKPQRIALHAIPLVFISTIPAKTLLGKDTHMAFLAPIVAAIMFAITRAVWRKGLRSYQSASS